MIEELTHAYISQILIWEPSKVYMPSHVTVNVDGEQEEKSIQVNSIQERKNQVINSLETYQFLT